MGGDPIGFAVFRRLTRRWKSWRSETTAGKEEALHERVDRLHHEIEKLRDEVEALKNKPHPDG